MPEFGGIQVFSIYAILRASLLASCINFIYVFISFGNDGYPRSVLLLYFILNTISVIGVRLSVRCYFSHFQTEIFKKSVKIKKLIYGAGAAGKISKAILVEEINIKLFGFVDDNFEKQTLIQGKKVPLCSIKK